MNDPSARTRAHPFPGGLGFRSDWSPERAGRPSAGSGVGRLGRGRARAPVVQAVAGNRAF